MSKTDDGGPAFPATRNEFVACFGGGGETMSVEYAGMSLRDWFAGQALAGSGEALSWSQLPDDYDDTAKRAYQLADAMLAARNRRPVHDEMLAALKDAARIADDAVDLARRAGLPDLCNVYLEVGQKFRTAISRATSQAGEG